MRAPELLCLLFCLSEPAGGCDIGAPVAASVPSQPADAVQGNSKQQPQQQSTPDQAAGQEQFQSLMAAMERQLQHAQALQADSPQVNAQALELLQRAAATQQAAVSRPQSQGGVSNASSSTAADALQSLLGTAAAAATAGEADAQALQQQQQPTQPPLLLKLGPVLARSVQQTQLLRLLAAMLLAYAVLTGWQVGLPPVAVLAVTDLAVVLAAAAVLPAKPADASAAGDLQVPWRLRSLDLFSLVPGLRELMDSLKGYNAVATAFSQDFAAFVVVSGLLLSTNAVPDVVSWGLRL